MKNLEQEKQFQEIAQRLFKEPKIIEIVEANRGTLTKIEAMKALREVIPEIYPEISKFQRDESSVSADYYIAGAILALAREQ